MNHSFITLLKIILLSSLLAFIIKYSGKFLVINPSFLTIMTAVFLPTLLTGCVLLWRWKNYPLSLKNSNE